MSDLKKQLVYKIWALNTMGYLTPELQKELNFLLAVLVKLD